MRLRADDRGVTVQIGTVLLFAVLIVLVSMYQASVVPQQNEQVEFNHNQRVHGELQDLRDELRRTAVTDSGGTASISLGTRYPERAFFVNPPAPAGRLRTAPAENVTVRNATAVGETGDYWDGNARNFSTRTLTYEPGYRVYRDAPTTVYDSGVLYNRFADANVTLAGQQLVRGNRISLVALNGSLSESTSRAVSVDARAVSAATRTVTVRSESEDEPVSVVLPTGLPEERAVGQWRALLQDERVANGGRVRAVETGPNEDADDVRIVFEPGTYELQMAKVGVGSEVSGVDPHYITDIRGDNASVPAGGKQRIAVEVRDRYNNPVSGATVNVSDSETRVTPERAETGSDGRATFVYEAPDEAGTETVAFNISEDPEPREEATVDIHVDGDGNGTESTYNVSWTAVVDDSGDALDCDPRCEVTTGRETDLTLTANVSADERPVAGATVDYALNDTANASMTPGPNVTDADGRDRTTLRIRPVDDTVTVFAASGDDVDPVDIRVKNPDSGGGGGGSGDAPAVAFRTDDLSHVNQDRVEYVTSYDVSNINESFRRVSVRYANVEWSSASGTKNSTTVRGNLRYGLEYGTRDEWNITARVIYENDAGEEYVAARESITDKADALNPDGNDDLAEAGSPAIDRYAVSDRSNSGRGPRYRIDYAVTENGRFGGVQAAAIGLESGGADSATTDAASDKLDLNPGYGLGSEFRVKFLVFDDDGAVVAVRAETDTAN